jgi:hypothetical protein
MEKLNQFKIAFYKVAYDRELERRCEGLSRLSGVVTIYAILGGVIAFFFKSLPTPDSSASCILFFIPFVIGVAAGLLGLLLLVSNTWRGVKYDVLQTPTKFNDAIERAVSGAAGVHKLEEKLLSKLTEQIANQYAQCASFNQVANDLREARSNFVLRLGAVSVFALVLSSAPYLYLSHHKEAEPLKVAVVGTITTMPKKEPANQTPQAAPPAPDPAATPAPDVELVIPEPRRINESFGAEIPDVKTLEQKRKEE